MFGKRHGAPTIIGPGSRFEGTLTVENELHIEGTVDGDVAAQGQVSVGPRGVVRGTLAAGNLALAGTVEGTVRVGGRLHMLSSGQLKGDAYYETLQVDPGGVVEGRTERMDQSQLQAAGSASGMAGEEPAPAKV